MVYITFEYFKIAFVQSAKGPAAKLALYITYLVKLFWFF